MKNSEFKKELNQKSSDSILRNQNYTFKIVSENYEANFDLIGLHKIIEDKHKKWQQVKEISQFLTSKNFFKNLLNKIETAATNTNLSDHNLHREIISSLERIPKEVLLPDSSKSIFLQNLYSNYPEFIIGAFAFFTNSVEYNQFNKPNYLKGVFLASTFDTQEIDVLSQTESATKSISQLKNEFEIEKIQILSDFEDLVETTRKEAESKIQVLEGLYDSWDLEYLTQINDLKASAIENINESNEAGKKLLKKSLDKKIQLEQAYREQMKFKAPAEYWRERAAFLNSEGKKFLNWLVALIVMGILILFSLLWLTPEDMLLNIFSGNKAKAIRWSILFITLISLLFVGIQALKKAMFSSFHLARDAEEREKLTIFYLSLIKDSTITQEDRSLVLQALFSRSDTGMLKDEGSPTMPGIIDKIKN